MNLAIAFPHKFISALRYAWHSMAQRPHCGTHAQATMAPALPKESRPCAHAVVKHARLSTPSMRLRVVRVVESGQPRSSVGRMVISGSMADVCAELDRLAACEAVLH